MILENTRSVRYQGAIVKDDHILLIRWREQEPDRSFWILPGGGREVGESDLDCVVREIQEETNLEVVAERLLLEEPSHDGAQHSTTKTYLCNLISGEARAGHEPEDPQPEGYGIVEVRWFDLRDEHNWDALLRNDPITYPQLSKLRSILGYL
jgi:8-oxo-dGTP pyrophosphatase MutT (NUDIX family)